MLATARRVAAQVSRTHGFRLAKPTSLISFASLKSNDLLNSHLKSYSRAIATASQTADSANSFEATATVLDSSPDVNDHLPSFNTLEGKIDNQTLKALTSRPFKLDRMSAVQAEVLPLLPELANPFNSAEKATGEDGRRHPRDLLVKARTGTGKTLAFLIPAVEQRLKAIEAWGAKAARDAGMPSDPSLEARARKVFSREHVGTLIISPTRELATQIAHEATRLTTHHRDFGVQLFVGGVSKRMQMRDWTRKRRDIVVATPGRLRDLLESEPDVSESIKHTSLLILDEADTLLDMGFRDDIEAIKEQLPSTPQRQTFLFSATVPRSIQQMARSTLDKNHMFINCVSDSAPPVHASIDQYHTVLPSATEQIPHVLRLIAHDQLVNPTSSKIVVFLPTTKLTQLFTSFLSELSTHALPAGRSTRVYEIHSKKAQDTRTRTSDRFRKDTGPAVLVTSDVSARGVDYPGVSRVIQVGLPASAEQYVHRVGRTGRGGKTGRGDLVLLPWEHGFVSWQLTDIPLKPLSTKELKNQVDELAKKYDSDPEAFVGEAAKDAPVSSRPFGSNKKLFKGPVEAVLQDMDRNVAELLQQVDEEAVKETFASMLGYYIPKADDIRIPRSAVVTGCKAWAVEACGLAVPPYVSDTFLQKLGVSANDRRAGSFKRRSGSTDSEWRISGSSAGRRSSEPWMERSRPGRTFNRDGDRASNYGDKLPRDVNHWRSGRDGGNRRSGDREEGGYRRRRSSEGW